MNEPLTEAEQSRLAFLEELVTHSGRFDNYEATASEGREYYELRRKAASGVRPPTGGHET